MPTLLLPSPRNALTADTQQSVGQLQGLDQSLCSWAEGIPVSHRGGSDSLSLP